jgi:hypothetical protein
MRKNMFEKWIDRILENKVKVKSVIHLGTEFEYTRTVDENGKILGEGPVVTNEDWARAALNGEQVSFNGSISFKKGTAQKGFIIFKHDNPSGLPENEVELLRIAVKF